MPEPISMPIIHANMDSAIGFSESYDQLRIAVSYPTSTSLPGPTNSSDGLDLTITPLVASANQLDLYAIAKGYIIFGNQEDGTSIRALLMLHDNARNLLGGLSSRLSCIHIIEYRNLSPVETRNRVQSLIRSAVAGRRTPATASWILQTNVDTGEAEESTSGSSRQRRRLPTLFNWLSEDNTIDDYLNLLFHPNQLAEFASGRSARERPEAVGFRVNSGDCIGAATTRTGTSADHRIFIKFWNERNLVLNPYTFFNTIAEKSRRLEFAGDIARTNRIGIKALLDLDNVDITNEQPPASLRTTLHPLIWAFARTQSCRVFTRSEDSTELVVADAPQLLTPPGTHELLSNLVPRWLSITFASASDINRYFASLGSYSGFIEWFCDQISGRGPWIHLRPPEDCCRGRANPMTIAPRDRARAQVNFNRVWDSINLLYGRALSEPVQPVNLLEFITLTALMMRETGLFAPISEGGNRGRLNYFFNAGRKRSYNTSSSNRTAFDLFNDELYIFAHSSVPPIPLELQLIQTTDRAWEGEVYPLPPEYPTSVSEPQVNFVAQADFCKFRGRGFVQSTFRNNYRTLTNYVLNYSGANRIVLGIKSRWEDILRRAAAPPNNITIGDRVEAALTVSTNQDWDQLFAEQEFACTALFIYFHARSISLHYSAGNDPAEFVIRIGAGVAGNSGRCSVHANLLRVLYFFQHISS